MPDLALLEYVNPPSITPLRGKLDADLPESFISLGTKIELHSSSPNCKLYFTTDGSEPDPSPAGSKKTFRYRQPFNLKPGQRTLRAIAVSRSGKGQSAVITRTFIVQDGPIPSSFTDSQSDISINSDLTHVLHGSDFTNLAHQPGTRTYHQRRSHEFAHSMDLPDNSFNNGYPVNNGSGMPMPPPSSGHPLNEYTVDENGFLIRRDKLNNGNGHPEDYQSEVYNFFRKERHKNSQEAWVESQDRVQRQSPNSGRSSPASGRRSPMEHSPGLYYGPPRRSGSPNRVRFAEHEDRLSDDVDLESSSTVAMGPRPASALIAPNVPVTKSRELEEVDKELAERHLDLAITQVERERQEREEWERQERERIEREKEEEREMIRSEREAEKQRRKKGEERALVELEKKHKTEKKVMDWRTDSSRSQSFSDDEETLVFQSNGDVVVKKKGKQEKDSKGKHKHRSEKKKTKRDKSRSRSRSLSPSTVLTYQPSSEEEMATEDIDSGVGHVRGKVKQKSSGRINKGQGHVEPSPGWIDDGPGHVEVKRPKSGSKHKVYDDLESLEIDLESLVSTTSSATFVAPDSDRTITTGYREQSSKSAKSSSSKSSKSKSSSSSSSSSSSESEEESKKEVKQRTIKSANIAKRKVVKSKEEEEERKQQLKMKKERERLEKEKIERKKRFEKREEELKKQYEEVRRKKEMEKQREEKKARREKQLVQPRVQTIAGPPGGDGQLSFVNDGGTQINIMGGASKKAIKEAQKQVGQIMKAELRPNIPMRSHQPPPEEQSPPDAEEDDSTVVSTQRDSEADIDDFFSGGGVARDWNDTNGKEAVIERVNSTAEVKVAAEFDSEGDSVPETESGYPQPIKADSNEALIHSAPSEAPAVTATKQAEQHSVGGFFKKIFKGWGGDSDDDEGPPKTVGKSGTKNEKTMTYEEITSKIKLPKLWQDPDFPADETSLYLSGKGKKVEWKRPREICRNPEMFVGGASRFDIQQGCLGNCWLLAAIASLAGEENMLHKVVPPEQSFKKNYKGVFRFRFWQYGKWVEVCIDDRLPTKNGKLLYMHSVSQNEFWSPLMEKAFAKLHGCYEALSGGLTSEAMTDFTGGLVEKFNFKEELPDNMAQIMLKAKQRGSLMGCSIDATPGHLEEKLDNGLIIGHAYSITDVRQVNTKKGMVDLVRVRNPWGNEAEWTGAWSDSSKEWDSISKKQRQALGLTFDHDGEFWMAMDDFTSNFQRVEICNVIPEGKSGEAKVWQDKLLRGAWKKKVNAGGCRNNPETYWTNPQYQIDVVDPDEDDDEDICTIIVALMQMDRRKLKREGGQNLTMGYDIFQVSSSGKELDKSFFTKHRPVATSPSYINMREIAGRARLKPGKYCIIPTTFDANEEANFMLRVYTENESSVKEVDHPTAQVNPGSVSATHAAPVHAAMDNDLMKDAEEQFRSRAGEDLQVDAYELKDILNATFAQDFEFGEFDLNICRSMVALKDLDHTGMLGLDEFKGLWKELQHWRDVFKEHDADNSGYFNSYELREALEATGFRISNATFTTIVMRYSDREGFIHFADFAACIIKLQSMFDTFNQKRSNGKSSFEVEEFIQMTMYT